MKLNNRMNAIKEYHFQKFDEIKNNLKNSGKEILDLSIGDPDLMPEQKILDAMVSSFKYRNFNMYPPYDGINELKEAIIHYYKSSYSVSLNMDEVIVLIGSKEGLFHMIPAVCDIGDYALIPEPAYPVYETACKLWGVNYYKFNLMPKNDYLPDFAGISGNITNKSKLMIINYPNNPTGAAANEDFYKEAVRYCIQKDIVLCNDGAYNEIIGTDDKRISLLQYDKNKIQSIEFGTFSKIYNMTGFRVGYAVGNKKIIKNLLKVKSNADSGQFIPIQYAAIEALKLDEEYIRKGRKIYSERKDIIYDFLEKNKIEYYRSPATFYIWCKVPYNYTCDEFCSELLNNRNILVTPGYVFGSFSNDHFRISVTQSSELIRKFME